MRIYSATLTRDIEANKRDPHDLDLATIKSISLAKGERHFRGLRMCKAWVDVMNREFGQGTAQFNGKVKG